MIGCDGPNITFIDLIGAGWITSVTNENRPGKLLIEHYTHLGTKPSNHVEVGNVDHVVTIEFLLLIDGCRSGLTLCNGEVLFTLEVACDIALGARLLICQICPDRTNAAERALPGSTKNRVYPVCSTREELWGICDIGRLREEGADILDTMRKSELLNGVGQASSLLCRREDSCHIVVCQGICRI